ncbi:hypothetical protein CgunFtcFv8_012067 [Champsocephalus gunnari]|uniref:Uncharacterized protein n=1 Tax=Champsocephalus gunnari TaxID=52237 RepID=A0AAN8HJ25_CHAGU|nr:hypothetical protein CgunFtcFv8_012067 [Champsocephalus gunnari]
MVSALESSAALVGRQALKLTVVFAESIRKPLEEKRPGMFPTSSHTKGATAEEWSVTVRRLLSACTEACKDTHKRSL